MRRIVLSLLAVVLLAGTGPAAMAMQATPAASPPASPTSMTEFLNQIKQSQVCAWPVEVGASGNALNVGFPDTNNWYFILPYSLAPGQSFVLHGTYPLDRFTSVVTYYRQLVGGHGLELLGWLPDYAITPDAGSANPAVDPNASTDPAQRRWTIRITGTASPAATPTVAQPVNGENVLPAMPSGLENVIGVMAMRVYVPNDVNSHSGGVDLPTITLEEASGTSRQLTPCTAADRETWKSFFTPFATQIIQEAPQLPNPAGPDAPPQWVETTFPGLGTNPDARYLMTPFAWTPGRLVVIRGKAPTSPNTRAGEPQTKPSDVRFWSFCTGANVIPLVTPFATSCAADFQIPRAADGTYTIVISQPADKPANATTDQGVAWMQGADPSQPSLMWLRQVLPSKEYLPQSVWAVPEGVPGAAQKIMGPYFPQTVYCDKATFERGGANACFAASGATPVATPAG